MRGSPAVDENEQVSDLIDTTEMYLRTIFELEEEGVVPLRARIAERLGHSGPTVSQTVARMERDGLLHVLGDRHLELTGAGRSKATRVMRKHRLAERLLLDVIGLEWELVHEEACRWEHVMSDNVEEKLLAMLTGPMESPYGNPIPGLDEIGGRASSPDAFRDGVRSLPDAMDAGSDGDSMLVRRLGERLQIDGDVMRRLADAGVRPGSVVLATRTSSGYSLDVSPGAGGAAVAITGADPAVGLKGSVQLLEDVARHIFVQAV